MNATISLQPGEFKIYGSSQATLSLDEHFNNTEKLSIYPNPTADQFQINVASTHVVIFDMMGRKVADYKGAFKSNNTFSIQHLKRGIYLVKVTGLNGSAIQKIIKK